LDLSFADVIRQVRERFEGRSLEYAEALELLEVLQALENALPARPVRPEFLPEPGPVNLLIKKGRRTRVEREWYLRQRRRREDYERQLGFWRDKNEKWLVTNATRIRIINNARQDVREALDRGPRIQSLPWEFLPKGELTESRMIEHLREFQRRQPEVKVDERRLREAYRLRPQAVYVGQGDFDGYFAFCFEAERAVLLDHPVVGNAAYVFGDDWRVLSRLPKSELLGSKKRLVVRVVHNGDWRSRLRSALLTRAHRGSTQEPPAV